MRKLNVTMILFLLVSIFSGCDSVDLQENREKPRIVLLGESSIRFDSLDAFEGYHDMGAVAYDEQDGDITDKIEYGMTSSVSIDSEYESYTYSYDVEDSDGNRADTVYRDVVVKVSFD